MLEHLSLPYAHPLVKGAYHAAYARINHMSSFTVANPLQEKIHSCELFVEIATAAQHLRIAFKCAARLQIPF